MSHLTKTLGLPLAIVASGLMAGLTATPALADKEDGIEKINDVVEVFDEIMGDSDTRIPRSLIDSSAGIAVIPDLVQGGFIVGAKRGHGLMIVRQPDGTWSNPAFLTLTGGSFGLQAGGKSSDVILLFRNRDAIEDLIDGDFEFGVSASGTAGPVGETALDPSETLADVLSYSRSEGLFGGVAVEGGDLDFDDDRNEDFYDRRDITPEQIFSTPSLSAPGVVGSLWETLGRYSSRTVPRVVTPATPATPATPVVSTPRRSGSLSCTTGSKTKNIGPLEAVRAAKNAARQRIEEACGGLSVYQAEFSMHGPVSESPYVTNSNGSWTFTFGGGTPGWEDRGDDPQVRSVVTVFPNGDVVIDSLEVD